MNANSPQFIFVALVLPSLFALSFIFEGIHKLMRQEPPWVPLITGFIFLAVILGAYMLIFK